MTALGLLAIVTQALVLLVAAAMAVVAVGLVRTDGRRAPQASGSLPSGAGDDPGVWPDVDVVLPAHDEEARLPAAIASLLRQDYPGTFTVWLVDDRSTDATAAIARRAAEGDDRVRVVSVDRPSRRHAPKVHAVARGIRAGSAAWIVTTDADCRHERGWLRALMTHARGDVVLVCGHVDTGGTATAGLLGTFQTLDWISLMLTDRVLIRSGIAVASASGNHAYARAAFDRVGGFGIAARAPSGDEDLLVQRLGRLPGAVCAFADAPAARVRTEPMPTWGAFLSQRRRWFSRFHHALQYDPGYLAGVGLLGAASVALTASLAALPFAFAELRGVLGAWGVLLVVQTVGLHVGLHQLGRRDLMGWGPVAWAVLQPLTIAVAAVWSFVRPGSWRAGARSYRRRLARARWRRWRTGRRPPSTA